MSNKLSHVSTVSADAGDTRPRLWTIGMRVSTNRRRYQFGPAKEEPEREGQLNRINLRNVWNSKLKLPKMGEGQAEERRGEPDGEEQEEGRD